MFTDAPLFNADISRWDVSSVRNMNWMFTSNHGGEKRFNQDLNRWDVSRVTRMTGMFKRAASFNGDISGWDVSAVTEMSVRSAAVCQPSRHVALV